MFRKIVALAALAAGGVMLSKHLRKSHGSKMESTVEESVEINVPVGTAYNQWTQFEEFPKFMKGVREVRQLDPTHLHWRAVVGGKEQEWDSEITEQIPDTRIAWHSTSGAKNAGVVTFHKISDSATKVMLQMNYEPHDAIEGIGDLLGLVKIETRTNLRCFKEFLEGRGKETGAWRGAVPQQ
jgi:uncharacterized membrane protein